MSEEIKTYVVLTTVLLIFQYAFFSARIRNDSVTSKKEFWCLLIPSGAYIVFFMILVQGLLCFLKEMIEYYKELK